MRVNRIILISLLSFLCIGVNAQYFAGGSVNLSTTHSKDESGTTTTDDAKSFSTGISPVAGIFLSDKLAIGLELNTGFTKRETGVDTKTITKTTYFGLSPFVKYYMVKWNKLSLYGQGTMSTGFSKTNIESGLPETESKTTSIGFSVYPGLSYDLSDKLSLQTSLNFLGLNCRYNVEKNDDFDVKTTYSSFGFGADMDNIVTIGNITIGAIYKF